MPRGGQFSTAVDKLGVSNRKELERTLRGSYE